MSLACTAYYGDVTINALSVFVIAAQVASLDRLRVSIGSDVGERRYKVSTTAGARFAILPRADKPKRVLGWVEGIGRI
jgi:hypothetical protein